MQLFIVSLAEAREHLPELIARVAVGDHVVIAEGGKSLARLAAPSGFPTTPEEIAATAPLRLELIRRVVDAHDRDGPPLPADHPLRAILAQGIQG